ncbi:MAG: OmpA family protein [Candidatus Anammoxibacter sp.]
MAKERVIRKKIVGVDMLAFSAIMTIMLAFFIMLTSLVKDKPPDELKRATASFRKAVSGFGLTTFIERMGSGDILSLNISGRGSPKKTYSAKPVENIHLEKDDSDNNLLEENIEFENTQAQTETHVPTLIGFDQGGYSLSDDAKTKLDEFISLVADIPAKIIVEGRAGSDEVGDDKSYMDWRLSGFRAYSVAEYLNDKGGIHPGRISIVGYGKHRPLVGQVNSSGQGYFVGLTIINN